MTMRSVLPPVATLPSSVGLANWSGVKFRAKREVRPAEFRLAEVRLAEVRAVEVRPAEVTLTVDEQTKLP